MTYLRNLGRRKARTTLTILGITIGIWALVVFGSMANKINALVEGGSTYYENKLSLSDSSGSLGGFSAAPMSIHTAELVRGVDGVAAVSPAVMMLMDEQTAGVTMGVPPMITGTMAVGASRIVKPIALNPLRILSALAMSRSIRSGSCSRISSAARAAATAAGVGLALKISAGAWCLI